MVVKDLRQVIPAITPIEQAIKEVAALVEVVLTVGASTSVALKFCIDKSS
jgi:hypothetical protein